MAINFTINAIIQKAPFEVIYRVNIPLLVNLLLSREPSLNPHTYKFASKIKNLDNNVKSTMHNI